ncbi:unnamed protein product [Durusdinium trenchii]|uniref:Uncharacterized protein n=2 Tax=Durusdinium trenchii TaxID=1381693 RepID=A0ABP0M0I3_9DINO
MADPFSIRPWNTVHLTNLASTLGQGEPRRPRSQPNWAPLQKVALRCLERPLSPASFLARKVAQEAVSAYPASVAQRLRARRSSRERGRCLPRTRAQTAGIVERRFRDRGRREGESEFGQSWSREFQSLASSRSMLDGELLNPPRCLSRGIHKMPTSNSVPAVLPEGSVRRVKQAQTLMSLVADGRPGNGKKDPRVAQCLQGIVRRTAVATKAAKQIADSIDLEDVEDFSGF